MRHIAALPLIALAITATPALAQDRDEEVETLRAQVETLNAQLSTLSARLDQLERVQDAAVVEFAASEAAAQASATTPAADSGSGMEVSMGAAPEVEGGGFTFKPFGRLMLDAGWTSIPEGVAANDGFDAEVRRARLGVEGDIPGGFGYKMEIDFSSGDVEITDALLSYEAGDVGLTVGQHNNFQSLEELTSSRFTSFIERAAFTDAFGFERRLGVSAQYGSGPVLVQAGVFYDNLADLPGSDAWSVDGRAVYFPTMGDTQLHFGGSLHYAGLGDGDTVRYRQRPLVHFTSERLVNTGTLGADGEFGAGIELAAINGPFHFAAEAFRQELSGLPGDTDADFFGGYIEGGFFLTPGDSRGYRGGRWNRTRPATPVGEGGFGALQVNLRYDYLDLTDVDAGVIGGHQNGYQASFIWTTTDYTRFQVNYGKLSYDDAVLALPDGSRDYSVDVVGLRAEFDF